MWSHNVTDWSLKTLSKTRMSLNKFCYFGNVQITLLIVFPCLQSMVLQNILVKINKENLLNHAKIKEKLVVFPLSLWMMRNTLFKLRIKIENKTKRNHNFPQMPCWYVLNKHSLLVWTGNYVYELFTVHYSLSDLDFKMHLLVHDFPCQKRKWNRYLQRIIEHQIWAALFLNIKSKNK